MGGSRRTRLPRAGPPSSSPAGRRCGWWGVPRAWSSVDDGGAVTCRLRQHQAILTTCAEVAARYSTQRATPEAEPQVAQGHDRPQASEILAPRPRRLGADRRGPEGGEPDVLGAGPDDRPRAVPVDQPGAVEHTEALLEGSLGHAGEPQELAGREHLVLVEQDEQLPVGRPKRVGRCPAGRASASNDGGELDRAAKSRPPAKISRIYWADSSNLRATPEVHRRATLREVLDHLQELLAAEALFPCKLDQLARPSKDGATFRRTRHGDAVAPSKLQQALVPEHPEGTEHGVGVHAEHRCQVTCRREPLSRMSFAFCDRTPDLRRHLLVQRSRLPPVDPDAQHDAIHNSITAKGAYLPERVEATMGPVSGSGVEVAGMATGHDEEVQVATAGQEPEWAPVPALRGVAAGAPPTDVPPAEVTDEQALIEEARRRQRRRHRWISAIVAVALVGTGLGLRFSFGTAAPGPKTHHRTTPSPAAPPPVSSSVALNHPEALSVASNGDVLIANQGTNQILRRTPDGTLTVVAGTGKAGYAGGGGPALHAQLNDPWGIAVAANGTLYFADTGNNRVRAISPSGTITTVAGDGHLGSSGVGGPAVDAEVGNPLAVALGSQGQLYIADAYGVQLVSPNGVLSTVIASGPGVLSNHGGPADAFSPSAIAVSSSGDLYVADSSPKLLVEFTPTGHVVNSWPIYVTPAGLASAPDGAILVADYGHFALDQIVNGQFTTLVTFQLNSLAGLTGSFRPSGIAVGTTGQIYTATDGANGGTNQPAVAVIRSSGQVQLLPTGTGANH